MVSSFGLFAIPALDLEFLLETSFIHHFEDIISPIITLILIIIGLIAELQLAYIVRQKKVLSIIVLSTGKIPNLMTAPTSKVIA